MRSKIFQRILDNTPPEVEASVDKYVEDLLKESKMKKSTKNLIKLIIWIPVCLFILLYATYAFVLWEFVPVDWGRDDRISMFFVWLAMSFTILATIYFESKNK